ncbi:MAG: ORC1-type DNA replication protein [Candidatus Odinarchaeia archaeon]
MSVDMLEEELNKNTVFRDETKLSVLYVPSKLPHRENEIKQLAKLFRPLIEYPGSTSRIVFISGPVGCGKTAVTKKFGCLIEKMAKKRGVNLKYIHINCRREKTEFLILLRIARAINSHIPKRGFSAAELLQIIIDLLDAQNMFILLTLDEIDFILDQNNGELIYDLTRLNDDRLNEKVRVSLILISKNHNIRVMLDDSTISVLSNNDIRFSPYTARQLEDILAIRAQEAFYKSAIAHGVINLIADIAAQYGDARYALELLWRAGRYADEEGVLKVFPDHVRKAKADSHPELRREVLVQLSKQDRILLLSIIRNLIKENIAYTTMGKVEETYHIICEEYGEKARGHTQLWERIKSLSRQGIIDTQISGRGIKGKTTLIGLGEAPVKSLEKELIKLMEVKKY